MTSLPVSDVVLPPPPAQPPGPAMLVLRVLIAVGLAVGMVQALTSPAERQVHDLLAALDAGRVTELTIERPDADAYDYYSASLRVEWDAGWRDAWATYRYENGDGVDTYDEGQQVLAAAEDSPRPVDVTVVAPEQPVGVTWTVESPALGLASLAALIVLIAGPQPRWATKWAWFWLGGAVTALTLVWALVEPVPLWERRPQPYPARRLTGGWAFLIALVAGPVLASLWWPLGDLLAI